MGAEVEFFVALGGNFLHTTGDTHETLYTHTNTISCVYMCVRVCMHVRSYTTKCGFKYWSIPICIVDVVLYFEVFDTI